MLRIHHVARDARCKRKHWQTLQLIWKTYALILSHSVATECKFQKQLQWPGWGTTTLSTTACSPPCACFTECKISVLLAVYTKQVACSSASESAELHIREGCFIYSELPLGLVTAHRVYHNICFIPDPNRSWDKHVRKSWISARRAFFFPPVSSALACLYSVTLTRHQSAPQKKKQKKKLFPIQFFTSCLGKVIILWCLAAPCVTNGASLSMCVIAGVWLLLGTRRVGQIDSPWWWLVQQSWDRD